MGLGLSTGYSHLIHIQEFIGLTMKGEGGMLDIEQISLFGNLDLGLPLSKRTNSIFGPKGQEVSMKRFSLTIAAAVVAILFSAPLASGQALSTEVHTYFFPLMVVGGGYKTEMTIVNVMPAVTQVSSFFYDQQGISLLVRVHNPRSPFPDQDWVSYNPGELPGNSSRTLTLSLNSLTVVVGGVKVNVHLNAAGVDQAQVSMKYIFAPDGDMQCQASVPPVQPVKAIGLHAVRLTDANQNVLQTGIAMVNPNWESAHMLLRLRDGNGVVVATAEEILLPGHQVSRFVSELMDVPASWSSGKLEIVSDQPIAAMNLDTTTNFAKNTFLCSTGTTFTLRN